MKKIPYPYEWMNSERLLENSPIAKENFYDSLNKKHISKINYEYYLEICERFNLKTNKDYHDLYLKLDICLLADVFENFRKNIFENIQTGSTLLYFCAWFII
eukprot:Lithocolla_globosa_v1_NODE_118_length_6146_cov_16.773600.p5 type:complete len:102 gc:universal NODE_118_length_6146_cov_16.773600:1503-1198(-)